MVCMDLLAASEKGKKLINIRDVSLGYQTAFWLEEGKKLTVTSPDGYSNTQVCRSAGSHHFYFGSECYHIDQFAELVDRNNLTLEPEAYVTDLGLFNKMYLDRELKDADGKRVPYRAILEKYDENVRGACQIIGVCPDAAQDRQVAWRKETTQSAFETTYYSISKALEELLPGLDLTTHEWKLLRAVFEELGKQLPRISQKDYDAIPQDYKGVYADYDGKHPEWAGRRTAFLPGHGTTLFIEGVSFIIEPDKKPSLNSQVTAAEQKSEALHKSQDRPATTLNR